MAEDGHTVVLEVGAQSSKCWHVTAWIIERWPLPQQSTEHCSFGPKTTLSNSNSLRLSFWGAEHSFSVYSEAPDALFVAQFLPVAYC